MGFLAEDTDHGTRELREIFKGVLRMQKCVAWQS